MKEDVYIRFGQNFILPFRKRTITYTEYEEIKRTYPKKEANELAERYKDRYLHYLQEQQVTIADMEFSTQLSGNLCITTGKIIAVCPAWEYVPVQTEEWEGKEADEYSRSSDEYTVRAY